MQRIVLIGMMGSGKSTVGRWVAEQLHLPFLDTDQLVVQAEGRDIPRIFAESGEARFREIERRVVRGALESEPAVISLGGGAFIDPETRALVKERAVSLYLNPGLRELVKRVGDGSTRPLLAGQNIAETMRQKLEERGPLYAEADYTLHTTGMTPERVGFDILTLLGAVGRS
ncbi:MAG: shikimate kinase [Verrucomicrobiota bacterium]